MGTASQLAVLSHDSVRSELHRILSSRTFRRAGRLRMFLEHIVEELLRDPDVALKEYHIGVYVFAKPASFDPQTDSIVRVEARRLRAKLEQYYCSEGLGDPLEIALPVGRYMPVIRPHLAVAPLPGAQAKSVAILPFKSLGECADDGRLAHALTEELAHAMMQSRKVRLLAWHSDVASPDKRNLTVMAREVDLGAVLEGSVYSSEGSVRVSVQLIRVPDGRLLWSQIYHRNGSARIELQQELASAIAREMALPAELALAQ